MLSAEYESALHHGGYDRNAFRALEDIVRNAVVRRAQKLVQDFGRVIQTGQNLVVILATFRIRVLRIGLILSRHIGVLTGSGLV